MRGADGGPWGRICALPAFWVGLLYDQGALDAAWDLVKGWDMDARQVLLRDSCAQTRPRMRQCRADAPCGILRGEVLEIARSGLASRARLDVSGNNETGYLTAYCRSSSRAARPRRNRCWNGIRARGLATSTRVYAEESF
jgi:glutamate--cysteine ligase